jgi:cobalt-zinc-cadmium efflux system protein
MSEDHDTKHFNTSTRIFWTILLNGLITLVELVGGVFSNSLALISDAVHNLSDTLALALAWVAIRVGKRKPNERRTFGYKRFEILSAFINASVLTALSIYLIYEAIQRFLHPEPVKSGLMLIIATIGLIANTVSVFFLHRDSKASLNVKAAYLHLLGDTFSSVAVIGGAFLIMYTGALWIDPLLTMVISVVIIYQALRILRESIDILMQSTPDQIKLDEIKALIESHPMVSNIHHVHCWQLQDNQIHFEAHLEITEDISVSRSNQLLAEIEQLLRDRCNIKHTTLQVEYGYCDDKSMIRQPGTTR